jgi:hypothetical protein
MYRVLSVKSLVIIGLIAPLAAFSQTPAGTTSNSNTIAPIAMPGPPVLTPPIASLPGSGPATGAPPSMDVNNAARGGSGSVYQPSPGSLTGNELPGTPGLVVASGTTPTAGTTGNGASSATVNVGLGNFVEGTSNDSDTSLADIARRYKDQHANSHVRQFDNNSVRHADYGTAETNAAALPQSDQPAVYGSTSAPAPNGVLDQHDYAAVQALLARNQSQANANASNDAANNAMPDPNRSASQAAVPAVNETSVKAESDQGTEPQVETQADNNARTAKRLPQSASPLPLILVFGLMALAVGGFTYRLRRNEA